MNFLSGNKYKNNLPIGICTILEFKNRETLIYIKKGFSRMYIHALVF